jgi:hypothetical protein
MLSRLLAYSTLLLPGWIHLLSYWFFSPNVKRGIEYGMGAYQRNVLDLYIPQYSSPDKPCQVIVFFGGGNRIKITLKCAIKSNNDYERQVLGLLVINYGLASLVERCLSLDSLLLFLIIVISLKEALMI